MPRQRHGRGASALIGILALGVAGFGVTPYAIAAARPGTAYARPMAAPAAKRAPGGNFADPAIRAIDIAQPAMVRVGNYVPATIDVGLCTRTVRLPLGGGSYRVAVTGSGAFISANGDVLTADHVVDLSRDEWDFATIQEEAQDIADLLNNASHYDPGCQAPGFITADEVANGVVAFSYQTHIGDQTRVVWRSVGYTGVVSGTHLLEAAHVTAEVTARSAFDQNDVAVLHVNETDTPSIALDDSTNVAVADHLTVVGFPGNADLVDDVTGKANVDNELTTSANDVYVSAIKMAGDGSSLIEVGGNVEHGDSGGPALDASGNVVGVVSFGGPDPRGLTTFLRTSNDALALARDQGIAQVPGAFERAWTRAFDDYAATYPGHWHAAATEMDRLATAYPAFQGLAPYKAYADAAAESEVVPTTGGLPGGLTLIVVAAAAVLIFLALIGGSIWFIVARRRARAKKAAAAAPAYGWTGGPTGYPPGYGPTTPGGLPPGYPPGYYGAPALPPYGGPPYPYGTPNGTPPGAPPGGAPGSAHATGTGGTAVALTPSLDGSDAGRGQTPVDEYGNGAHNRPSQTPW